MMDVCCKYAGEINSVGLASVGWVEVDQTISMTNNLLDGGATRSWYHADVALICTAMQEHAIFVACNAMMYDGVRHAIRAARDHDPSVGHAIVSTPLPVRSEMLAHAPALFFECNVADLYNIAHDRNSSTRRSRRHPMRDIPTMGRAQ